MTLASGFIATLDAAPSSVPSAASRAVAMPSAVVFDKCPSPSTTTSFSGMSASASPKAA